MHPEIAELVRSTLYPTLSDAPSTLEHPPVVGLKKRLFWLDHQQPETHSDMQSTSHSNDYEVEMTTALVSHLIKQGVYKPGSIAVLTPYVGQLKKLQLRMQSSFEVVLDDRDIKELEEAGLDDAALSRAPPAPGVQKGSMASCYCRQLSGRRS
jgi:superfamily I DNA and/or RNA helicase